MTTETQVIEKDPKNGQFIQGYSGNPAGRPKGARNKLGEEFIQKLYDDFQKHGVAAIEKVRIEKPDAYLKVIAGILPKDLNVNVNRFDGMSEEQMLEQLRRVSDQVRNVLELHSGEYEETVEK